MQKKTTAAARVEENTNEFIVDRVLTWQLCSIRCPDLPPSSHNRTHHSVQFRVHWEGYTTADDTWEPRSSFADVRFLEREITRLKVLHPTLESPEKLEAEAARLQEEHEEALKLDKQKRRAAKKKDKEKEIKRKEKEDRQREREEDESNASPSGSTSKLSTKQSKLKKSKQQTKQPLSLTPALSHSPSPSLIQPSRSTRNSNPEALFNFKDYLNEAGYNAAAGPGGALSTLRNLRMDFYDSSSASGSGSESAGSDRDGEVDGNMVEDTALEEEEEQKSDETEEKKAASAPLPTPAAITSIPSIASSSAGTPVDSAAPVILRRKRGRPKKSTTPSVLSSAPVEAAVGVGTNEKQGELVSETLVSEMQAEASTSNGGGSARAEMSNTPPVATVKAQSRSSHSGRFDKVPKAKEDKGHVAATSSDRGGGGARRGRLSMLSSAMIEDDDDDDEGFADGHPDDASDTLDAVVDEDQPEAEEEPMEVDQNESNDDDRLTMPSPLLEADEGYGNAVHSLSPAPLPPAHSPSSSTHPQDDEDDGSATTVEALAPPKPLPAGILDFVFGRASSAAESSPPTGSTAAEERSLAHSTMAQVVDDGDEDGFGDPEHAGGDAAESQGEDDDAVTRVGAIEHAPKKKRSSKSDKDSKKATTASTGGEEKVKKKRKRGTEDEEEARRVRKLARRMKKLSKQNGDS